MSRRKLKEEEGQKSLETYITPKSERIKIKETGTPRPNSASAKRRTPPSAEGPVQKRLNLEPTIDNMEPNTETEITMKEQGKCETSIENEK